MIRSLDIEANLVDLTARGMPADDAERLIASDAIAVARDLGMTLWAYFVATAEDGDRIAGIRFDPTKTAAFNAAMVSA